MFRDFLRREEVSQIYVYEFLKKAALGLISIFIPIYLISEGFGLLWAFYFLFAEYTGYALFSFPVSYLISRIGFKHSLIFSYFFYLPSLLGLRLLHIDLVVLTALGLLFSLGKCFHNIALHAEFSVDSVSEARGKQTGYFLGIPRVGSVLAPALGGFIMASFGFGWLVAAAVSILLLSVLPLTASRDYREPYDYGWKDFLDADYLRLGALIFLRAISSAVNTFFFPIYVFLVIGGEINAGLVSSLAGLGVVFFTVVVGRLTDRVDTVRMMFAGLIFSAALLGSMAFVSTVFQAFLISILSGMVSMLYVIPMFSSQVDMAEKENVLEFFAFREASLAFGRVLVLLLGVYVIVSRSSLQGLKFTFYLGAAATLAMGMFVKWIERKSSR